MVGDNPYVVELVDGNPPTSRRGLAFLICKSNPDINAKSTFDELNINRQRQIRTRFQWWLDGKVNDKWFHGWPNEPSHKDCFVFKWKENRQNHRLYGFLCHPLTNNPRFQLCVLVSHASKNQLHTNPRELDGANKFKENEKVKKAIQGVSKTISLLLPRS